MDAPLRLKHQGKTYSGTYRLDGDEIEVLHGLTAKLATLGGLPHLALAEQLLFEIVVREGKGVPDHPDQR
jgi:hypothetical protein